MDFTEAKIRATEFSNMDQQSREKSKQTASIIPLAFRHRLDQLPVSLICFVFIDHHDGVNHSGNPEKEGENDVQ